MKCPFLITRKDVFDKAGKKVGEEIELQECIKNDCMIYDGATKLCSLLSSNMKSGVLIDDVKAGFKEMKDEMSQRDEALGVVVSTTVQTLQVALLGRFDILKKQNEVMVLGFDRLVETINNKFEGIKNGLSEFNTNMHSTKDAIIAAIKNYNEAANENLHTIKETLINQVDIIRTFQTSVNEIKNTHTFALEEIKKLNDSLPVKLSELGEKYDKSSENINAKFDILKENLEKMIATNQIGMETISGAIEKGISSSQEILTKLGQLDTLVSGLTSMNNLVRTEMTGLKTDIVSTLNGMLAKFDDLGKVFSEELKSSGENVRSIVADFNNISEGIKQDINDLKNSLLPKFNELGTIFIDSTKSQGQSLENLINNFGTIGDGIKTEVTGLKDSTVSLLENFTSNIGGYFDTIKSEIGNLKADQSASLNNVQGAAMQLQELFRQSSDSLASMSDMMRNLNNNYIESLGKIAGLAEGMKKGVDKVGEGMHDSVKDLVKEMKTEIGALEKQYEKTFGDIANLAGKFDELNKRIKEMTKEVETDFKDSFERQTKLSDYTKTILEHIKEYFEKEDARYKEEQLLKKKKEGLDHFDRATLYYYRGNYEIAVNEINKALEIEKTAEYFNLKGLLLAELGKFDESKKTYKEALKIEPNLAEIHNNLGLLYLKIKKLDDAVVSFHEAVKKNVNYALAYVNLGKALIELEQFDDAIKAYEKALEIDPSNYDAREAIRLYKEGKIGS
jgi:tetratricopeptide (TPR) repeat protein